MKWNKLTLKIPPELVQRVYHLPAWQKIMILLVSWAVPVALFWVFFLSPRLGEIDIANNKIPKLKKEIALLEAKANQIPKLERELRDMEGILQKALKLLPEKEDIPTVLTQISSLGNSEHLEFLSFSPKHEQVRSFYAAIPISMDLEGPFHNTISFFDKISRMGRIVQIKEINMGGAKENVQIWSQKAQENNNMTNTSNNVEAVNDSSNASEPASKSAIVIKTKCRAETYRFLTPEEQQAQAKKKKSRGKRKKRR